MSMDSSGKIIWARHSEIQQANLKAVTDSESIADGERLPLAVKDMGSCEIYPQTIAHNPNGRLVENRYQIDRHVRCHMFPGLWWCVEMESILSTLQWHCATRRLVLPRSLCGLMTPLNMPSEKAVHRSRCSRISRREKPSNQIQELKVQSSYFLSEL
jgi:hypothetical protein